MPKRATIEGQETRALPVAEARVSQDAEGRPVLEGYAVLWESWSEDLGGFRERFVRGALSRSIEEDDIRVIWQHNPESVIGRNKAGTAELEEQDGRLASR